MSQMSLGLWEMFTTLTVSNYKLITKVVKFIVIIE